VNVEALKAVREELKKLSTHDASTRPSFNLAQWAKIFGPEDLKLDKNPLPENLCGSTACAIGTAMLSDHPALKELEPGWDFVRGYIYNSDSKKNERRPASDYWRLIPQYKGEEHWGAVCAFFQITPRQALYVFDNDGYDRMIYNEDHGGIHYRLAHSFHSRPVPIAVVIDHLDFLLEYQNAPLSFTEFFHCRYDPDDFGFYHSRFDNNYDWMDLVPSINEKENP
tara:strand:+ start:298 stop:969 length:672 start_codon:yes stop_codon:yes gene_type:complete